VLSLAEVDQPKLSDHGVLVRVHAASVHAGDWHLMRGTPFLLRLIYGGILKPKYQHLAFFLDKVLLVYVTQKVSG